jgi:SAM-dependent methyltransferase
MNILKHNREAWNRQVESGNIWTLPVGPELIERARGGDWSVVLTPTKQVPRDWFPSDLEGKDIICRASGGGQQGPILAAAGAAVTVYDASPLQLAQDRLVARRESLALRTVEGDMADLSAFDDATFDLIFHPCSNCFAPKIRPVWQEASRVLRPGAVLLAGFNNPLRFLFPDEHYENGDLTAKHGVPWDDSRDLPPDELKRTVDAGEMLQFGHTLTDQIGGQLAAGFVVSGFYEDNYGDLFKDPLSELIDTFIATRAVKM